MDWVCGRPCCWRIILIWAGKSTTIRMVLGLIKPDRGQVIIDGYDIADNRFAALEKVGALVEGPAFYEYLTAYENLKIFAQYSSGVSGDKITEVLDIVGLSQRSGDKVKDYSMGMKQRLGIAQGLCLIFISSLAITLAIIFDSAVISLILSFCFMIFSFIAGNIEILGPILPTTYWLVWKDIMKKNILWGNVWQSTGILLLYSIILYLLAWYFYNRKDVKI